MSEINYCGTPVYLEKIEFVIPPLDVSSSLIIIIIIIILLE